MHNPWIKRKKISIMIGSFATTVAKPSSKIKPITNARTVLTTCSVRTVTSLSFTSIRWPRELCQRDLALLSPVLLPKYWPSFIHVKSAEEKSLRLSSTTRMRTEPKTFHSCANVATMTAPSILKKSLAQSSQRLTRATLNKFWKKILKNSRNSPTQRKSKTWSTSTSNTSSKT